MSPVSREVPPRPWWALAVAASAFAVASWLVAAAPLSGDAGVDDAMPMMSVAPGGEVELASLPVEHQLLYEAAAADHDAFTQVRCYCGCEAFLDHRDLLACFERPEGGWERHATGCAVCLSQAEAVVEQRANGVPIDEIVRHIDRRYGAMTATT